MEGGKSCWNMYIEGCYFFPCFIFLYAASARVQAHKHTHTHRQKLSHTDMQIDCCTAKCIGDFIDESLKSSPKQNKLFTSQLESNGGKAVVAPSLMINEPSPAYSGPWPKFTAIPVTHADLWEEKRHTHKCLMKLVWAITIVPCHSNYNWFAKLTFFFHNQPSRQKPPDRKWNILSSFALPLPTALESHADLKLSVKFQIPFLF